MSSSDLTVDETVLLHSIGWQALELVCGSAVYSIPKGFWSLGKGESQPASLAWERAVAGAVNEIAAECRRFGGAGVAGTQVEVTVDKHYIEATLTGTAVNGPNRRRLPEPFVSDLSVRDFVLLQRTGWQVAGLVGGASFVFVPRRKPTKVAAQAFANVELSNFTAALYTARSAALERMQRQARRSKAAGVVAVRLDQGTMSFARHAMHFAALGTAIQAAPRTAHQRLRPVPAVNLNDPPLPPPHLI